MIIIDGHNDMLLKLLESGANYDIRTLEDCHVNLNKLQKGNIKVAFFAIYVPNHFRFGLSLHQAMLMVDLFWENFQRYNQHLRPILTATDLIKVKTELKIGGILSLEGGEVLEGNLANLRNFYRLGVRALTLTWNNRNELADGVGEGKYAQGLSKFGYQVIETMNQLGMIIDVSHLSEKGFWDVLSISKGPIIASHSNSRSLCNHPRNLWDQQIKGIANQGGVIGVNFYPPFVTHHNKVDLAAVVDQIVYLLNIGGSDSVGIGSDFDGIEITPKGLEDISKTQLIIAELKARKIPESIIEKIMGGNFYRVIGEIFSKGS